MTANSVSDHPKKRCLWCYNFVLFTVLIWNGKTDKLTRVTHNLETFQPVFFNQIIINHVNKSCRPKVITIHFAKIALFYTEFSAHRTFGPWSFRASPECTQDCRLTLPWCCSTHGREHKCTQTSLQFVWLISGVFKLIFWAALKHFCYTPEKTSRQSGLCLIWLHARVRQHIRCRGMDLRYSQCCFSPKLKYYDKANAFGIESTLPVQPACTNKHSARVKTALVYTVRSCKNFVVQGWLKPPLILLFIRPNTSELVHCVGFFLEISMSKRIITWTSGSYVIEKCKYFS